MPHPRDGFQYPFIERVEIMDGGLRLGAIVRNEDGTLSARRWRLDDILDLAEVGMTSNITA